MNNLWIIENMFIKRGNLPNKTDCPKRSTASLYASYINLIQWRRLSITTFISTNLSNSMDKHKHVNKEKLFFDYLFEIKTLIEKLFFIVMI